MRERTLRRALARRVSPEQEVGSRVAYRRQAAPQAGARPFEGAVDRFDGRVEHVGHFVGVVSEHLAQDEHGALASRQDLQRGHEGQGDGFGLCVAGLRAERDVDAPRERVGIRLEPHDFTEASRLGRLNLGDVPLLGRASAGRAKRVEAPVGGDPVEPGAERGASLESSEALPGGQERLLQGVLGVLEGSEHPVAVHLQLSAVRFGQLSERVAVSGPRPDDQVGCHYSTQRDVGRSPNHLPSIDTGRVANWARPLSRHRGVCIIDGSDDRPPVLLSWAGCKHPRTEQGARE